MRPHIVFKLRERLPDSGRIPYWLDFIKDKSVVRESVNAEIDRLMSNLGLKFWLTNEYRLSVPNPSAAETAAGLDRTYRMILHEEDKVPADLVARIRQMESVEEAREIDVTGSQLPAPQVSVQASIVARKAHDLIYLPYARLFTKGNGRVSIAILDTGADTEHAELKGKFKKRADFVNIEGLDTSQFIGDFTGYDDEPDDEVGHGTHVAGIIAARGLQMDEGVAPDCSLMAVRVLATMRDGAQLVGAGIIDNINTGIKWAVDNGADVINMSLGIRHTGGGLPHQDVIRYALAKDVTVVAASGNDGTAERYYPGALKGVFAVGAIDEEGEVASFTSYGANVFVVAPGTRIYSSFAHHKYAFASGTSQAAPFAAGMVGLMKSYALERGAKLTNSDVADVFRNTSDGIDRSERSTRGGYGLINLADAFRYLNYQLG